jgi:hypothetical protein
LLKLATTPSLIGSVPTTKTIGMLDVAAFAASTEGSAPATRSVAGRRTNSAARAGM